MPITVTQLARRWCVSHQYVSKLAKKGMPLSCEESASNWRDTFARRRAPTDRKQLQLLEQAEHSAEDNLNAKDRRRTNVLHQKCLNRPLPPADSLEFFVESARQAVRATHILLQQALEDGRESKIVAALRNYNAALDARLKIEQRCRKEADYRRHLIPMKAVRLQVCEVLNIFVSKLVALPEKVGPACNPEAPAHAIAILRDECATIIADIKKSGPVEFVDGVVWPSPR
jgi:hypothetical protein